MSMEDAPKLSILTKSGASGGCTDREELKTVLSYATFHRIIEKSE